MTLRQIIAAIIFIVGFLLIVGAVGQGEFSSIEAGEFWTRVGIGFALMIASFPVSGEIERR